ncbi:hypothetical protein [Blastococcus xanthinilyticus]|uniref:Immunity protein 21 of polymorphic toxin system n=1 Tax=Blastococcus xanthinilyticus TaxID=1564164 RepID=A0A5S5CZH1_9ACTN|nr:hypothetical protein [Blastococcus xanthinilyticus]TYP89151.1 hypothetical protein BD833_103308 [Blastococcus xanthinilyticus]
MPPAWTHVGRFWTNGEPFLALDEELLPHWRGLSDEAYEALVPRLDYELTSIPVGPGSAAVVLTDPEIGDEGWLEVFRGDDGSVAVVQVAAGDYRGTIEAALRFPSTGDQPGDAVPVASGRLAFISAALDGTGEDGALLLPEQPGPTPASDDLDDDVLDPGSPLLVVPPGTFGLSVLWRTELYEDAAFARWLFSRQD